MKAIKEQFEKWKDGHDDDYIYDCIDEFFASLSRSELCEIIENIIKPN